MQSWRQIWAFTSVFIWGKLLGMSLGMDFGLLYKADNRSHQRVGRERQGQRECVFVCEMTLFYSLQHLSTLWAIIKTWDFPSSHTPRSLKACRHSLRPPEVHLSTQLISIFYYTMTPISNIHNEYHPLQFSVWYSYLLFLLEHIIPKRTTTKNRAKYPL